VVNLKFEILLFTETEKSKYVVQETCY